MDIIECAMKKESDAKTWYEKLAADVKKPELKELFSILASSEDEHLKALRQLKGEQSDSVEKFAALDQAACAFRPLLEQRNPLEALKGDPDGFRHIVTEEEESIRFYERLATHATDEGLKRLLDKLVEQEKRHLNIVQNIFDFVESPRTYLAWGEFSNLQEY